MLAGSRFRVKEPEESSRSLVRLGCLVYRRDRTSVFVKFRTARGRRGERQAPARSTGTYLHTTRTPAGCGAVGSDPGTAWAGWNGLER